MFLLDSLLIDSLAFVMDKIATAADAETLDDSALRERLLDAQMRLELGELSQEAFDAIEREVFDRLRERRADRPAALSMTSGRTKVVGVEAYVSDELDDDATRR